MEKSIVSATVFPALWQSYRWYMIDRACVCKEINRACHCSKDCRLVGLLLLLFRAFERNNTQSEVPILFEFWTWIFFHQNREYWKSCRMQKTLWFITLPILSQYHLCQQLWPLTVNQKPLLARNRFYSRWFFACPIHYLSFNFHQQNVFLFQTSKLSADTSSPWWLDWVDEIHAPTFLCLGCTRDYWGWYFFALWSANRGTSPDGRIQSQPTSAACSDDWVSFGLNKLPWLWFP